MRLSVCSVGRILILNLLLAWATSAVAANQVIGWYAGRTSYFSFFATNSENIISAAAQSSIASGLTESGSVIDDHRPYTQTRTEVTNIVSMIGTSWYVPDVGGPYALGLRSDGTVFRWWGFWPASQVPEVSNVVAVAGGLWHYMALRSDGTVQGWGGNNYGELNIPPDATNVVAIAAGAHHTIALRKDGTVVAWGDSGSAAPPGLSNIVAVAGGAGCSFAVRDDGRILAWGNFPQQLLAGVSNVAKVVAGPSDAVLKNDGTVMAWGPDGFGHIVAQATPPAATNVIALYPGFSTLAILGEGLPRDPVGLLRLAAPYGLPLVLPAVPGGTRALRCQWKLNGTSIPGGESGILFIPVVDFTNSGTYAAELNFWYGQVTNIFSVDVVPFVLARAPQNQSAFGGDTVTFAAGVLGSGLSYQWRFNGADLAGATSSALTLTNVRPEQAGSYSVVFTNAFGRQTVGAELSVTGTLEISAQPTDQLVWGGENASFSVEARGVSPIYYQWRFAGAPLPGETSSSLMLTNIQLTQSGLYSVTLSNAYDTVDSSNALLTVFPLAITAPPQNIVTFKGATAVLSVTAAGLGPISYQWAFEDAPIAGATTSTLVLTNSQLGQSGTYAVSVSDPFTNLQAQALLSVGLVANWNYPYAEMQTPAGLTDIVAIATGGYHNVALRSNGTVQVWGLDTGHGELNTPPDATNVIAVAATSDRTIVLRADGTVLAWGQDLAGDGAAPEGISNVVAIDSGASHGLALRDDGVVISSGVTTVPWRATNMVAIAGGYLHSLALRANGTVMGWGGVNFGQASVPVGLSNVVAIACGAYDSLALREDGSIVGWGQVAGAFSTPADGIDTVQIAIGYPDAYARKANGRIKVLGGNTPPVPPELRNVVSIAVGYNQVLALIGDSPRPTRTLMRNPKMSGNQFTVSVASDYGRVYRLEYSGTLESANWVGLPLVAGTGRDLTLRDINPDQEQRFYRVRRW